VGETQNGKKPPKATANNAISVVAKPSRKPRSAVLRHRGPSVAFNAGTIAARSLPALGQSRPPATPITKSLPPCLTGTSQQPVPPATRTVRHSSRAPDGGRRNTAKSVPRMDVFFKCIEMSQPFWSVWKRSQTRKDTVLRVIHDGISVDSRTTTFAGALPDDNFAPLAALRMHPASLHCNV
jgi:hypothetical protein